MYFQQGTLKMAKYKTIYLLLLLVVSAPVAVCAEDSAANVEAELDRKLDARQEERKEKQFPKSGTLASTSGGGTSVSGGGFGKTALSEEDTPPIGGSVNKQGNQWIAHVANNSSAAVSASFKVVQVGKNGNNIKSDSFSASLAPGKSMDRTFSSNPMAVSARLEVLNWKSNRKKEEPSAEAKKETETAVNPDGSNQAEEKK